MCYLPDRRFISVMADVYQGEDVHQQNSEDIDPDRWLDQGELAELPEIPILEVKEELLTRPEGWKSNPSRETCVTSRA